MTFPFVTAYDVGPPFILRRRDVYPRSIVETDGITAAARRGRERGPFLMRASASEALLLLDFGEEVVGQLQIQVRCPGQCVVRVYYGEVLAEARRTTPYPAHWYSGPHDAFTLGEGAHALLSAGRRAFRFLHLRITGAAVEVLSVKLDAVEYPVEARGRFACSDPRLDAMYEIAARTTRLCMQQFYEDGIKRDGLLWVGDYRVQYLANVGAFGDAALARRSLLMIAASQRSDGALPACAGRGGGHQHPFNISYMGKIPFNTVDSWILINYCADYLCAVHEYFLHTADRALVVTLQPCLRRLVRYLAEDFRPDEPDLMQRPMFSADVATHFADNGNGFASRATLCAQVTWAFACGMRLAGELADQAMLSACTAAHQRLTAGFHERRRDTVTGMISDETNRPNRRASSLHAPAFAALAGLLAEGDGARRALGQACADPDAVRASNGYCAYFIVRALFEQGLIELAFQEMQRHWGAMLDYGLTTCAERLPGDGKSFDTLLDGEAAASFCHGWSAGPAHLLPAMVLGVRPHQPGYAQVTVQPALGPLTWAEGAVPTPHGDILVRWDRGECLRGRIQLPAGVCGVARPRRSSPAFELPLRPGTNEVDWPAMSDRVM